MAQIRSKISEKSPYYISKYRFLELKNFCRQYSEWRLEITKLNWYGQIGDGRGSDISDPTERLAERAISFKRRLEMVEQAVIWADPDIYEWILRAVTEGIGYGSLNVPCSRDYFYDRYRRFFWKLSQLRG